MEKVIYRKLSFIYFFFIITTVTLGQEESTFVLQGKIYDQFQDPIPFASVSINDSIKTTSDIDGNYRIQLKSKGSYTLKAKAMSFQPSMLSITITEPVTEINLQLDDNVKNLKEVVIDAQTIEEEKKEEAYAVEVIDMKEYQNRDISVNQVLTQAAGIRVRQSGGLGSNTNYSLNGMSDRSIRFFVDGIPIDRMGDGYSTQNFPVNLIERIEVYKGVVPPEFGSDALGGVINLVTKTKSFSYLDASYSYGSFNTHRAALSGRWVDDSSGLFVDLQGFYNYSDNNYRVWGPGVEVADPTTGRAVGITAERFHDQYQSISGKAEIGFQNRKWADQMKAIVVYAANDNEIQHGTTMSAVYGEATHKENAFSPSLLYSKEDLFFEGFDAKLYSSVSFLEGTTVDTSSRTYDWNGEIIDVQPTNSEIGRGRNGKSLLTLESTNWFQQVNLAYAINENNSIKVNYTLDLTIRDGLDEYISDRTASFVEPQNLRKQVSSLAYELKTFKQKLIHTAWVKNYDFKASSVDEQYITDSLGYRPVAFPVEQQTNNFGYGYAVKFLIADHNLLKLSIEKCYRIPSSEEVLGDGLFVRQNPYLSPEKSLNLNFSWLLNNFAINNKHTISVEPAVFFRNTSDQILYQLQANRGTGAYYNVRKVRGYGASLDAKYAYKDRVHLSGNVTYQQMRDWNEYDGTDRNLTYKDLLPNTPYLMGNLQASLSKKNLLTSNSEFSFFWDVQYVHQFYLRWPSLGAENKAEIPSQLINNTGISYSLHSGMYNIGVGCNNVFNEQVYDNYLLQKPGRSYYIKFRVYIK